MAAMTPVSLRRRAAVAVLGPLLDDTTLMQELWIQHDTMKGEAVSDIIKFVDSVAGRQMLDAATCKRLYADFFKALREADERLPLDPWPAMQATRAPAPAPVAPPAAVVAAPAVITAMSINPVATALAAASPAAAPKAGSLGGLPSATEPPIVFGAVMRAVIGEVAQYHSDALVEVGKDALSVLDSSRAGPAAREAFRAAWPRALQNDWQISASHADLAELMRVVYHALSEAFGRVGADQILQRAVQGAEGLPEARQFSPKRLLAAL